MIYIAKISREKFKVYNNVFDNHTIKTLNKLSAKGYFVELTSTISPGKEANVFSAVTDDDDQVIVKIYRVENCNFNKMYDYIRKDTRFIGLRKQKRKIIFAWVMREFRNLMKARDAGVLVPKPIAVLDNVLILEYIGNKNGDRPEVSPQLKNSAIEDPADMFDKIIDSIKKMHEAHLVHGDLSAFNILNKNQVPYFIDFSQATTTDDVDYWTYMKRDVKNLCNFFKKLDEIRKPEDVLEQISGRRMSFEE